MAKYLDKSGVTYLWNKIKGLFTDQSLNTKNKTYAGAINEINTKVGNLTGAFLWKGKFDTLPAVTNYEAGNVVGVGNKEYVLTVTEGTKTWEEFGDEGSYLLKTAAEETYLKKAAGEVKTANLADNAVTSTKLDKGARNPIILTEDTTEVDEETYLKLIDDGVDVVFKDGFEDAIYELVERDLAGDDTFTLTFISFFIGDTSTYFAMRKVDIEWGEAPHKVTITKPYSGRLDKFLEDTLGFLPKNKLTPVLQEIDLTGTDAERKTKLDQFETDWKALTGASDLSNSGVRFVGRCATDDGTDITGVLSYDNAGTYVGIFGALGWTPYKVEVSTNGSIYITPLFSHLEAITIYTYNTPEHMQANLANIAAYEANLQAFGVDMSKGFNIPVMVQGDNWGGYISSIGSGFYVGFYRDDTSGSYAFRINADGLFMDYALALSEDVNNKVDKSLNAKSLEAITIKTDNSTANVAAIKAYVDNLKALGVDTTKGYEIPILYNNGSKGFIGYNPNAASSFNGYAVTPEGNLHTLTMNATTGALSNKILATTAITDALSANKQPKTDAALKTTSKTVTGAINEVNDKTAYMAFTDVTKLSTNLGKRLIYKGGNVTLSSPITINSNINEIDFNGATLTVGSLAKTGISVITGHSHCIIKNLIISGTWSVNTDVVNNIIDTFAGVENVSIKVVINGTHYGRGFNSCQRLINCKAEIYGTNITAARAYNYCDYLYMCRVGANSKGTGFFHCTSMDSCDIFNGGCTGSELIECSKYTKVSYYVSGNRRYFSDVDNISTKTLQINGINIANIAELSNVIANSSESVNSVPIIDPNDKSIQKMGVVIGNADNGGTGYSDNPTVVVRNTSGNIFINDGHYNGIGCTTKYATYLVEQNKTDISGKQDKLISGTNIKTINGQSLLGSGDIAISGGGDVTAAGDNTFTGNNVFSGIAIADILDGTQYQITGDNGVLMFTSGATNEDIQLSGVATPTYSNSAANKSYVDTQINTALGTVLTQLQNI